MGNYNRWSTVNPNHHHLCHWPMSWRASFFISGLVLLQNESKSRFTARHCTHNSPKWGHCLKISLAYYLTWKEIYWYYVEHCPILILFWLLFLINPFGQLIYCWQLFNTICSRDPISCTSPFGQSFSGCCFTCIVKMLNRNLTLLSVCKIRAPIILFLQKEQLENAQHPPGGPCLPTKHKGDKQKLPAQLIHK